MFYLMLIGFKLNYLMAIIWGESTTLWMLAPLAIGWFAACKQPDISLWRIAVLTLMGISLDLLLVHLELISFSALPHPKTDAATAQALPYMPAFMWILWASFIVLLPQLSQWLGRKLLPLLAIAGPLSYSLGAAAGQLTLAPAPWGIGALACVWLLLAVLSLVLFAKNDDQKNKDRCRKKQSVTVQGVSRDVR
jgi:hypothetical protein